MQQDDQEILIELVDAFSSSPNERVGFVFARKESALSDVRSEILKQFDDTQLNQLRPSFHFRHANSRVSILQEGRMDISSVGKKRIESDKTSKMILEVSRDDHRISQGYGAGVNMLEMDQISDNEEFELQMLTGEEVESTTSPQATDNAPLLPPHVEQRQSIDNRRSLSDQKSQMEVVGEIVVENYGPHEEAYTPFVITVAGLKDGVQRMGIRETLSMLQNPERSRRPLWIDVQCASTEHIREIGRALGLHILTIEDCSSRDTREKLEMFKNYLLMVLYSERDILLDREVLNPISITLFSNFLVTFHRCIEPSINLMLERIQKTPQKNIKSASWVCHSILDIVVDSIIPITSAVIAEVDVCEDLAGRFSIGEHNEFLHRVSRTRQSITYMRERLWPKHTMVNNLVQPTWRKYLKDVPVPYFRDVQDHVSHMLNSLKLEGENLHNTQTTFLAKVSIEVAASSNEIDHLAKRFGSFATILLPLTLISSMWGMNVRVPGQYPDSGDTWCFWFLGISLVMMIFVAIMCFVFKRHKWI
eukprot:116752_1